MRQCRKCTRELSLDCFSEYVVNGRTVHRRTCKACRGAQGRQSYQNRKFDSDPAKRENHLRACRDANLRREYGITLVEYEAMVESQSNTCKICGESETRTRAGVIVSLSVDHCHETGEVRGLLCSNCNVAIGLLKHEPRLIHSALTYLSASTVRK